MFRRVAADEPILVLVSGVHRVDEAALAALAGEEVERASGRFVRERTGFAIGGVPPLGHRVAIETLLDEGLLDHTRVFAAAGTPHHVFGIEPAELARVTGARVVALAERDGPAA